ncbi:hypothetical protein DFH09DRAFT_1190460 [Mycena vulgaris]|nr:hypothetical protein DFH09DRAFT_1190460 [Mycena vulgaris]
MRAGTLPPDTQQPPPPSRHVYPRAKTIRRVSSESGRNGAAPARCWGSPSENATKARGARMRPIHAPRASPLPLPHLYAEIAAPLPCEKDEQGTAGLRASSSPPRPHTAAGCQARGGPIPARILPESGLQSAYTAPAFPVPPRARRHTRFPSPHYTPANITVRLPVRGG